MSMSADNILLTVRGAVPTGPPAERRVADAVLDDAARISESSITAVARLCRTSETTVLRFCRAIGLQGYPELRIALARAAQWEEREREDGMPRSGEIDADDSLEEVVAKITHADARSIDDTARVLDIGVLADAVEAVLAAGRVNIYGVGASSIVADDLHEKLHRIGLVSFVTADPHRALASAALLTASDLVVGISHSGTTTDTVDVVAEARRHGATAVCITNHPDSPLAKSADLILLTAARETTFRTGAMASRIAQLAVVDCLFAGVAQRRYERSIEAFDSTFDAVRTRHLGRHLDRRK
jgi:DNA-binding MurR/RpiR family transcriptional regulator